MIKESVSRVTADQSVINFEVIKDTHKQQKNVKICKSAKTTFLNSNNNNKPREATSQKNLRSTQIPPPGYTIL